MHGCVQTALGAAIVLSACGQKCIDPNSRLGLKSTSVCYQACSATRPFYRLLKLRSVPESC